MALKQTIKVLEGDDEAVRFTIMEKRPDGVKQPYPLIGSTIDFLVKPHHSVPDDQAHFVYTNGVDGAITISVEAGEENVCVVQFASEDLARAGIEFHRLSVEKDGRRRTASYGPFEIESV